MKRALLHLVRRWVPEFAKAPVRSLLHRLRDKPRGDRPTLESMSDGTIVFTPVSGPRMRLVSSAREAAFFQFWSDPASADEMRQFRDLISTHSLFFDVGSHFGLFATVFALGGQEKQAVAFEPVPASSNVIREHARLNELQGRILVREVALGDRGGEMHGSLDPAGFAHFGRTAERGLNTAFEMSTIDAEVDRLGRSPDLLKIDVEGYEAEVLAGASGLLAHRPLLFLELHLDLLERRRIPPADVLDRLQASGYRRFSVAGRPISTARILDSTSDVVRIVAEAVSGQFR